jgi:hypothetical protein
MNDFTNLKNELTVKIHDLFRDNQAYLTYLLQTKQNFLYRYLETSTDKNVGIESLDEKTFIARSQENNMGEAFKINDAEIKEGIKSLAKSVPREQKPAVQYSLKTTLEELTPERGKIIIESKVNWGFPDFLDHKGQYKMKRVIFIYNDPAIFRKELAIKYEEACEIFI